MRISELFEQTSELEVIPTDINPSKEITIGLLQKLKIDSNEYVLLSTNDTVEFDGTWGDVLDFIDSQWDLLKSGTYTISLENGNVIHSFDIASEEL